jgi:hypothetical protein
MCAINIVTAVTTPEHEESLTQGLNYKKYYEDNNNLNQIVKSSKCVRFCSMDVSNRRVRVLLI